jgi:hypothetical protein
VLAELTSWLEQHMITCYFREHLGLSCPGCGSQRAFILLLKGEWVQSFLQYPALVPFLATLVMLIAHLIFKFTKGGTWLKYMFIGTAGLVMANFIVKLFIHQA